MIRQRRSASNSITAEEKRVLHEQAVKLTAFSIGAWKVQGWR